MYYIGIDGGAAFNKLICLDESMKVIGRHMSNSSDLSKVPFEVAQENLTRLLAEFGKLSNTRRSECRGICIGSACAKDKENRDALESMITGAGLKCPVTVVRDTDIILAAQTREMTGVVIIAAAEARGYARGSDGAEYECGNWGYMLDNGCSGFSIGLQALKHAFSVHDGRAARSPLYDKVLEHYCTKDIHEIMTNIYGDGFNKSKIAALALCVKYASEAGDKNAKMIEETAARELFLIAKVLLLESKMTDSTIVLSGNVVLLNDAIRSRFTGIVKKDFPEVTVECLGEKPELGAAYIAMGGLAEKSGEFPA